MIDYLAFKKKPKLFCLSTSQHLLNILWFMSLSSVLSWQWEKPWCVLRVERWSISRSVSQAKRSTDQCMSARVLICVTQGGDWLQSWQFMGVRRWIWCHWDWGINVFPLLHIVKYFSLSSTLETEIQTLVW